jgi:hypothetical protein
MVTKVLIIKKKLLHYLLSINSIIPCCLFGLKYNCSFSFFTTCPLTGWTFEQINRNIFLLLKKPIKKNLSYNYCDQKQKLVFRI